MRKKTHLRSNVSFGSKRGVQSHSEPRQKWGTDYEQGEESKLKKGDHFRSAAIGGGNNLKKTGTKGVKKSLLVKFKVTGEGLSITEKEGGGKHNNSRR